VSFSNSAPRNITLDITSDGGCNSNTSLVFYPLCVLPVTLLSFDAQWNNGYTSLYWETGSETGTDHFELERSTDGITYHTLSSVTYVQGITKYVFSDRAVPGNQSEIYYRLKLVNRDQQFTYSSVKRIKLIHAVNNAPLIWPNPFSNKITISLNDEYSKGNLQCKMFSAAGKLVAVRSFEFRTVKDTVEIDQLNSLPAGFYIIQLVSDSRIIGNYKIIKRNP
ncbi:MAG: T9SS type A sorting domain-containing protein, partial [Bacteroidetes bacterium]|nr:T9SS type A sorting domain-containing protein [Bacteroidota bacterium]